MHDDRFFDPDPTVRRHARAIYAQTAGLPIVSPHGHVDPALLARDAPFPEPASLMVRPDHYVLRMLYSRGVPLERLGIAPTSGDLTGVERDGRRIWQLLGDHYYLFRGTPTAAWLDYQIGIVFGIPEVLTGRTAARIYDAIAEKLQSPEFRPRALFDRFRIEVLATTDAATDPLDHHKAIRESGWPGRVIPTFRPDALFQIASPAWTRHFAALVEQHGEPIDSYPSFVGALERRRAAFRQLGATATDHGVESPRTERVTADEVARLFEAAVAGRASRSDQARFESHMLMEMARMSSEDGLVMQLHSGSFRNHHHALFERFGPDRGADIPVQTEFTRHLHALLNAYGAHGNFRLIVFTLDESTYARELAPLAGHYPSMRLGPPWWFHDSVEGMTRYRQQTTETAGIYNTAGFNDDTRAFCSIPARHDLCRRVDANWLAGLVARHVVSEPDAREMATALAYGLAKEAYRLEDVPCT